MERIINSNKDKQTIYEIYRACRLCGAGAGYKMPIIQSVVDLEGNDVELKQKILECLQIEVHHEDKMPPLVCELCVDKVNDFYEFLNLCRQTNKRTRQRLGLPLQAVTRGTGSDSGDCILGVTEPVYVPDEDDEPLTRNRSTKLKNVKNVRNVNVKIKTDPDAGLTTKKEPELRVKLEKKSHESLMAEMPSTGHTSRHNKRARSPSPPRARTTRNSGNDDNISLNSLKKHGKREPSPSPPRGRSTRNSGNDDNMSLNSIKKHGKRGPSPSPPRGRSTRNSGNDDNMSLNSIKQQVKWVKSSGSSLRVKSSPASKETPASKPQQTLKPENRKPGPASKSQLTLKPENRKPGPASKSQPTLKPEYKKPGPASKSEQTLKPEYRKPGPVSKPQVTLKPVYTKPGPASKTGPSSKSSSKSPASKSSPDPRPTLKRDVKKEEPPSLIVRAKRLRDKEPEKDEVPLKKLKISLEKAPVPKPKSKEPPTPPMPIYTCEICLVQIKNSQGHASHMKTHTPNFTNPKLACNACGEWFSTVDEIAAHHRQHRTKHKPYHCRRCDNDFKQMQAYDSHFDNDDCVQDEEVEDKKCYECWLTFPTEYLLDEHKCQGEDGRPGGKCSKCSRSYALLKNLKKHESTCTAKRKGGSGEVRIDPAVQAQLLPYYVRMARCDSLLTGGKRRVYDVSDIPSDFGLDKDCIYPYRFYRSWFKSDFTLFDSMVSIKDDVKNEFCNRDFVHWDSEESGDSDSDVVDSAGKGQIESLAALTLKIIFSQRYVGKVPRKRRKEKVEKGFNTEFDTDLSKDIKNIIDNLNIDTNDNDSMKSDSIMNSMNSNNTETVFDDLKGNDSKVHEQQDKPDASNEDSSKIDENAMEVDENHAVMDKDDNKKIVTSKNYATATSEIEKNNLVSSSKQALENKETNSTEQIILKESDNESHNNDTKVNGETKQIEDNEEIDDKRLEELDAHIGENDDENLESDQKSDENNDKQKIDDNINVNQKEKVHSKDNNVVEKQVEKSASLIQKENNLKGMDLDNVSEEETNFEV